MGPLAPNTSDGSINNAVDQELGWAGRSAHPAIWKCKQHNFETGPKIASLLTALTCLSWDRLWTTFLREGFLVLSSCLPWTEGLRNGGAHTVVHDQSSHHFPLFLLWGEMPKRRAMLGFGREQKKVTRWRDIDQPLSFIQYCRSSPTHPSKEPVRLARQG